MDIKLYYNTTVRIPYSEASKDELYRVLPIIANDVLGPGNYVGAIRDNNADLAYDVEFIHAEGIEVSVDI